MEFRIAHLVEGVRLDSALRLEPYDLWPIPAERGFGGQDLRNILNAELRAAGAVTVVDRPSWGVQVGLYRLLAFAISGPVALPSPTDIPRSHRIADTLAAGLTLTFGGTPRVVATVVESRGGSGDEWAECAVIAGGGPMSAPSLVQSGTDDHPIPLADAAAIWDRATHDERFGLWLSLYRDALAESRWDTRTFRACVLLEAIADEVLPKSVPVVDDRGVALLLDPRTPATTAHLRGALYALVQSSARALGLDPATLSSRPDADLWSEIQIWADVRNAVAHTGSWSGGNATRRLRLLGAFDAAGRGDAGDGMHRYALRACAGVELALRATEAGAFGDTASGSVT